MTLRQKPKGVTPMWRRTGSLTEACCTSFRLLPQGYCKRKTPKS